MKRIFVSISMFMFVIPALAIAILTAVSAEQTTYVPVARAEIVAMSTESTGGLEVVRLDGDDDYLHPGPLLADPGDYPTERAALMSLYDSTGGQAWYESDGWGGTSSYCTWYGVNCDLAGHVLHLNLQVNWLVGPIPPAIANLVDLQTLDLSGNLVAAPIPEELGNLAQLQILDLSGNEYCLHGCGRSLGGAIPASLGKLSSLQALDLSGNEFAGAIPAELGDLAQLRTLDLSDNYFCRFEWMPPGNWVCSGGLHGTIPAELSGLSALEALSLQGNQALCWQTEAARSWALTLPLYSGPTDCYYMPYISAKG